MEIVKLEAAAAAELARHLPVALIAIDSAGRVQVWNGHAAELLGWSRDEVFGQPAPVDFPAAGPDEQIDVRLPTRGGGTVDVQLRSMVWQAEGGRHQGRLVILCDVSAQRHVSSTTDSAAEALVSEQSRFRELLENAPDAIIEVGRDGLIRLANQQTEHMFGYARAELVGQPVELLVPDEFRSAHASYRRGYTGSPTRRAMGSGLNLEGRRKDGSRFAVEISLSPVTTKEGLRVTAIVRDVSERRRAEEKLLAVQSRYNEELAAKNRELEARNAEVERANALKSEFLSGMSHELRTPLHTIIGFAELLAEKIEGPLTAKQERFVGHVLRDSQHLLALINDVLDLSKIESGRLELHREVFSLPAIEETLASVRPRAESKSIRVSTRLNGPGEIFADRLRLRQILYNLLSNAVKFTPAGGEVWVESRSNGEMIEMAVCDTGIGIPEGEREAVFDKFYQVGQRQALGHEGTGLGLAITRRLVREHGGEVTVESEPGRGSCFRFTIPAAG